MNFQDWKFALKTEQGKKETIKIWENINRRYYNNLPTYFEYLVFRILLSLGDYENDDASIANLVLDEHFQPLSHAGSGKRDFYVKYNNIGYVIEATQRPILGKVEHWGHIRNTREEFNLEKTLGCLITQPNLNKVDLNVWSIYKAQYTQKHDELFMICDINFLIKIINEETNLFIVFLDKSEQIWTNPQNTYIEIRKKILLLQNKLLNLKE